MCYYQEYITKKIPYRPPLRRGKGESWKYEEQALGEERVRKLVIRFRTRRPVVL